MTGGAQFRDADRPTLVACSGGCDSSALALALAGCGARVVLGHVLHDLRGGPDPEADRDVARGLSDRLQGMSISHANESGRPKSTLLGELEDQAALAGVLRTLYDLHFALLAVAKIAPGDPVRSIPERGAQA